MLGGTRRVGRASRLVPLPDCLQPLGRRRVLWLAHSHPPGPKDAPTAHLGRARAERTGPMATHANSARGTQEDEQERFEVSSHF